MGMSRDEQGGRHLTNSDSSTNSIPVSSHLERIKVPPSGNIPLPDGPDLRVFGIGTK